MRIEHFAINVAEPKAMAAWCVEHLGWVVQRAMAEAPWTHFLGDADGHVLLEIYDRKDQPQWTAASFVPLLFHFALVSEDLRGDLTRLCAAGATVVEETIESDGYGLVMLRDPWGVPVQLCRRREPFSLSR